MQGANHLVTEMCAKIDAFMVILIKLCETQLSNGNTGHFSELTSVHKKGRSGQEDIDFQAKFQEHVAVTKTVRNELETRFIDIQELRLMFAVFETPFSVKIEDIPVDLLLKIIKVQNNQTLRQILLSAKFDGLLPVFSADRVHPTSSKCCESTVNVRLNLFM